MKQVRSWKERHTNAWQGGKQCKHTWSQDYGCDFDSASRTITLLSAVGLGNKQISSESVKKKRNKRKINKTVQTELWICEQFHP